MVPPAMFGTLSQIADWYIAISPPAVYRYVEAGFTVTFFIARQKVLAVLEAFQ
jgi:hypothetical protein